MKKLSFVLALIIALSTMVGLFATPAYAADEYDVVYTVDGVGGKENTYATVSEALTNCIDQELKYGIHVTADTKEAGTTAISVCADVTVYSTVVRGSDDLETADADESYNTLPKIELSSSSFEAGSTTTVCGWLSTGASNTITFKNIRILADFGGLNYCGVFAPANDGTIKLDGTLVYASSSSENYSSVFVLGKDSAGNISVVNESRVQSTNRGLYTLALAAGNYKWNIINSVFYTNLTSIQANATSANANMTLNVTNSTLTVYSNKSVANYLRPKNLVANLTNSTFSTGRAAAVIDTVNQNASTHIINAKNCTFGGGSCYGILTSASSTTINLDTVTFNTKTSAPDKNYDVSYTAKTGNNPTVVNLYNTEYTAITECEAVNTLTAAPANLITAGQAQLLIGTTAASESTSVRLILTLTAEEAKLADFSNIGIYIAKNNECALFCTSKTTNKVYSSIKANGYTVDAVTGSYFVLIEITDIPKANFDDTIYIRPFVTTAEGVQIGEVKSFTVTGLINAQN